MIHAPLAKAKLLKRYKRFLVDIEINDEIRTIYCANTGAMTGCADPGFDAYFSKSDNPKRKYQYSLEKTVNSHGHFIGVNTIMANHIVKEAIEQGKLPTLDQYDTLTTEVKYGQENSRIDILLQNKSSQKAEIPPCYVEVKSTTLLLDHESGLGAFPDAKTTRGQKHLRELMDMIALGNRAVLVFLVQHTGISEVTVARHIDPAYAALLEQAVEQGLEVVVLHTDIDETKTEATHTSEFKLLA